MADGVERISLKAGPGIVGVSAIVVFSSHYAASMAKKVLVEGRSSDDGSHHCKYDQPFIYCNTFL